MSPEFIHTNPQIFVNEKPHSVTYNGEPRAFIFDKNLFLFSIEETGIQMRILDKKDHQEITNPQMITENTTFNVTDKIKLEIRSTI